MAQNVKNNSQCDSYGSAEDSTSERISISQRKRDKKQTSKNQEPKFKKFNSEELEQEIENIVSLDPKVREIEEELDELKRQNLNKKDL